MTTREIVATFKDLYGADVSASLIYEVTDAVIEQVVEWQSRPLDTIYPIVYLDCIVVKIRQDKQVINKVLALGVNMVGHKELLGMWLSETPSFHAIFPCEQTKFRLVQRSYLIMRRDGNGRQVATDRVRYTSDFSAVR